MKLQIYKHTNVGNRLRTFTSSKLFEVINNEIPAKEYWFNNLRIYKR